jgi:hypothetical protein
MEGPFPTDDLGWVKTLFEKIRSVTPHPEINNRLLRKRVLLAYRERFGIDLNPVDSLKPQLRIVFKEL